MRSAAQSVVTTLNLSSPSHSQPLDNRYFTTNGIMMNKHNKQQNEVRNKRNLYESYLRGSAGFW